MQLGLLRRRAMIFIVREP
jgi:ABC-type multidrug transport system permease subunit